MPSAARINDISLGTPHCHSVHPWSPVPHPNQGPITTGSSSVTINDLDAARVKDPGTHKACCGPMTFKIVKGSGTVIVDGQAQARLGDQTLHCNMVPGAIITGSSNVIVGG